MKVLFAISNEEISESIVKKYQAEYKQIISSKNVYYFNAILKEIQKDKTYDRIVISEDLEAFTHSQYDQIDKFIFDKLDSISDEASNGRGKDIPIILICTDRRMKSEPILVKLFGIGIYNALIGANRSVEEVCALLNRPRTKKEAKEYYRIGSNDVNYSPESENDVSEVEIQNILSHYKKLGKDEDQYVESFDNIAEQYNDKQLRVISRVLPLNVRAVLEEKSPKYQKVMSFSNTISDDLRRNKDEDEGPTSKLLRPKVKDQVLSKPVVIPSEVNMEEVRKLAKVKRTVSLGHAHKQEGLKKIPEEEQTPITTSIAGQRIQLEHKYIPVIEQTQETQSIVEPVQPVNPVEPVQKVEPVVESVQPVRPVEPVQNVEPVVEPVQPVRPVEPVQKVEPVVEPVQPVRPVEPVQNVEPVVEPTQPVAQDVEDATKVQPEIPKKRGRGRPRKYPVDATPKPAGPKRGRGRPRKNPVVIPELEQQPVEQKTVAEPVKPVQQVEPVKQANVIQPIEDVQKIIKPIQQAQPIRPVEPIEPVYPKPGEPIQTADVKPIEKTKPIQPIDVKPVEEVKPIQHSGVQPVEEVKPVQPVRPVQETHQNKSTNPFSSVEPLRRPQQNTLDTETQQVSPLNSSVQRNTSVNGTTPNQQSQNGVGVSSLQSNQVNTLNQQSQQVQNNNTIGNNLTHETTMNLNNNNMQTEVKKEEPKELDHHISDAIRNAKPLREYKPPQKEEVKLPTFEEIDKINSYGYTGITKDKKRNEYINTIDISSILGADKKLVAFLGTSKNGTSFIVNNLAELASSMGIKTAILDTTTNRNSYYIYTKNEEGLREVALGSFDSLINKQPQGIQVNKNLTVFTSLPDEDEKIIKVDEILETLARNYSLILIDTDFNTPIGYFKQAQELYLVQSLDILTIQPLTAFLRKLKSKNVLEERKIRIIINKAVKVRGIQEKTIIGGMAYYTDPAMSYMTELFDRNTVKYITIPFEDDTYIRYLENIINCEVSLKGYSKVFMQSLKELANMVYPLVPGGNQQNYRPPSASSFGANNNNGGGGFSPNMNNTLNQMKNNF